MSMLEPWSFTLQFCGRTKKHGELLMTILDDYLKNVDYTSNDYGVITVAEWASKIFFELKKSSMCGTAECTVTMFILGKLPEIVLQYRNQKKGDYSMCSQLWSYLKDSIAEAKKWHWG